MKEKIFISGPMNETDFTEIYKLINKYTDADVFCVTGPEDTPDLRKKRISRMLECDKILMLEGWAKEERCQMEKFIASKTGMQILYVTTKTEKAIVDYNPCARELLNDLLKDSKEETHECECDDDGEEEKPFSEFIDDFFSDLKRLIDENENYGRE